MRLRVIPFDFLPPRPNLHPAGDLPAGFFERPSRSHARRLIPMLPRSSSRPPERSVLAVVPAIHEFMDARRAAGHDQARGSTVRSVPLDSTARSTGRGDLVTTGTMDVVARETLAPPTFRNRRTAPARLWGEGEGRGKERAGAVRSVGWVSCRWPSPPSSDLSWLQARRSVC